MRESQFKGKDKIAGTPTKRALPANRTVGGLPEPKLAQKARPRRVRRGG